VGFQPVPEFVTLQYNVIEFGAVRLDTIYKVFNFSALAHQLFTKWTGHFSPKRSSRHY
jgi:hypothetical protein